MYNAEKKEGAVRKDALRELANSVIAMDSFDPKMY